MRSLLAILRTPTLVASAIGAFGLPALVLTWWLGPWSPGAMARADRLAEQGLWNESVDAYVAVARWSPDARTRSDALYVGGAVAAMAGLDTQAVRLLRRFDQTSPDDPRRDEALVRLGTVYEQLGNPVLGARAYEASLDFESVGGGDRHLHAGDLWFQAERPWLAWAHWERASEDPETAQQAWLRMARTRLQVGDYEGADEYYLRMIDAGASDEWEQLARLGRAVCAEGRGNYDQALAELESLDGEKVERARERVARRDPRE